MALMGDLSMSESEITGNGERLTLAWRRTWPDDPKREDYCVRDARGQIARVMLIEHGPQAGSWQWTARTKGLPNSGTAETKEAAMAAAKARWEADPLEL